MGKGKQGSQKRHKPKPSAADAGPDADAVDQTQQEAQADAAAPAPAVAQPLAMEEAEPAEPLSKQEMESSFMAALQRAIGDVELTEDNVRKAIAQMTPEERQKLQLEGQGLKQEILTSSECEAEQEVFRKEVNERAAAAGLPVEKDGEHLGKKILAFMNTSVESIPQIVMLSAVASTPYLVKLAVAEATAQTAKAEPVDLSSIEQGLTSLKVEGWTADEEMAGRPPFVRRNLLLLYHQMYAPKLSDVTVQPSTQAAAAEVVSKSRRLLDMLFKYALQNRWVKAALAVTEVQALLSNGLWDMKDDECIEIMREKMSHEGLKMPKLKLNVMAHDALPGEKVSIKVEAIRYHAYTEAELEALKAREAADGEQEGQPAAEPLEGWWVIGEALRKKPATKETGVDALPSEPAHNSLVGRAPLTASLALPSMSCQLDFDAPDTPGEYKVMVHVRSSGCVGVDVRRKVVFQVLRAKRALPTSSSGSSGATEAVPELLPEPAEEDPTDDVPALEG